MSKAHLLAELRDKIGFFKKKNASSLSYSQFKEGIPRPALIEVIGPAKVEWLLGFFRENPELKVFWLEEKFNLLPLALFQHGVCLDQFWFAETSDNLFKAARQVLRSQAFECLVLPGIFDDELTYRTLQLFTEEANACTFILSEEKHSAWPISVQVKVDRSYEKESPAKSSGFSISLLRFKGGGFE